MHALPWQHCYTCKHFHYLGHTKSILCSMDWNTIHMGRKFHVFWGSENRNRFYIVHHTKRVLVIVSDLAPQSCPIGVQLQMAVVLGNWAKDIQCFGDKSVDGCSWILFGVGWDIYLYFFSRLHQKVGGEFWYEKVAPRKTEVAIPSNIVSIFSCHSGNYQILFSLCFALFFFCRLFLLSAVSSSVSISAVTFFVFLCFTKVPLSVSLSSKCVLLLLLDAFDECFVFPLSVSWPTTGISAHSCSSWAKSSLSFSECLSLILSVSSLAIDWSLVPLLPGGQLDFSSRQLRRDLRYICGKEVWTRKSDMKPPQLQTPSY